MGAECSQSFTLLNPALAKSILSLTKRKIPTLRGGEWSAKRIIQILNNEKYTGDSMLQKKFVGDHLTKKLVRNKGELPSC